MEKKEYYEIAFVIPFAAKVFPQIRNFLKTARKRFDRKELVEIHLYSWIGGNSIGVVLRFNFDRFTPAMLKWFAGWIQDLRMEVNELEKFGKAERDAVIKKLELTSDLRFTGKYDLEHALNEIEHRFARLLGVRKEQRVAARMKVKFRSGKEFRREYTENISYGGMFIRGRTDLPLRSRIEITFELPGIGEEVKAIAEVVHVVTPEKVELINGDRVAGCGIQFVEFVGSGEKKLKEYVNKLASENGGE